VKSDKEISFAAEHVGIRTYRVTFNQDLKPGEYAFFMAAGQQVARQKGAAARAARARGDFTISDCRGEMNTKSF